MITKLGFTCAHKLRLHWMWVVQCSDDPYIITTSGFGLIRL